MTKKLEKKYLSDGGGGGGVQAASSGDTHRRSMVWTKVKELKCASFDDAIAKLGSVFQKCNNWRGDSPRGGTLRIKGVTLAYKRKLSEDDGVTTHVRVVQLGTGAFSFESGSYVKTEEPDGTDDDDHGKSSDKGPPAGEEAASPEKKTEKKAEKKVEKKVEKKDKAESLPEGSKKRKTAPAEAVAGSPRRVARKGK